jgi:hypothetical protein
MPRGLCEITIRQPQVREMTVEFACEKKSEIASSKKA